MPALPASKIDIGHLPLPFRGHFEQAVGIQGFPARRFHRLTGLAHGGATELKARIPPGAPPHLPCALP